jgi:hypothetical protein
LTYNRQGKVALATAGEATQSDVYVASGKRKELHHQLSLRWSTQVLLKAGIPLEQWNVVDATGDPDVERRLDDQLQGKPLSSEGYENPVMSGPEAPLEAGDGGGDGE